MLEHIRIKHFAIIDELDLELNNGLTVITGETGAGKSIMVDAIALVLGERARSGVVKHGHDKAEISLILNHDTKEVSQWLNDNDLDDNDQCHLRRVLTSDGKSRCYINGHSVTLNMMGNLSQKLVEISGQNTHQNLLSSTYQRNILDSYAGIQEDLIKLKKYWDEWHDFAQTLEDLQENSTENQLRLDLVTFQLEELQELELQPNEIDELHSSQNQLAHSDQLAEVTSSAEATLYEAEQSVYQQLATIKQTLDGVSNLTSELNNPAETLAEAMILVQETATEIRGIKDTLNADPESLFKIEKRLELIHALARKHRVDPFQLQQRQHDLEDEFHKLSDPLLDPESLKAELKKAALRYDMLAATISKKRKKAALEISELITETIQSIGLEGGRVEIILTPYLNNERKASGLESVKFAASMNPGQPVAELAKVASGGELSRLSLAIQLITAKRMKYPALIFDEVDAGIGGATAETVGKLLLDLSQHCQVFCITHLAQIASKGDHHLKVAKAKSDEQTTTDLFELDSKQRIDEIARMLAGETITDQSRAHAKEMLAG